MQPNKSIKNTRNNKSNKKKIQRTKSNKKGGMFKASQPTRIQPLRKSKSFFLSPDEIFIIKHLLSTIDRLLASWGIIQEFYSIGNNVLVYLRFQEENSYFYFTSFNLNTYNLPDKPDKPDPILSISPTYLRKRLSTILESNTTYTSIRSTMCLLNGLNFAYFIQGKIILSSLLQEIYMAKKDDDTAAAEENSLRNFNFLLGFWFVDPTQGIQFPPDEKYDEKVKEIVDQFQSKPKKSRRKMAALAEDDSDDSDYKPSDSESDDSDDEFEEEVGTTVITTDATKWAFGIYTLSLMSQQMEEVIIPKISKRVDKIITGTHIKEINDKKEKLKQQSGWTFLDPKDQVGERISYSNIDECFDYLKGR